MQRQPDQTAAQNQPDPPRLLVYKGATKEASKLNLRSKELANSINNALSKLMNAIDSKNRSQAELQRLELVITQIVQMARGITGNKYIAEINHFLDELVTAKHMFKEAFRLVKTEDKSDAPSTETITNALHTKKVTCCQKLKLKSSAAATRISKGGGQRSTSWYTVPR